MVKVCLWPTFNSTDEGDGGIRRVVEAQTRLLPKYGVEVVETPEEADVLAAHVNAPDSFYDRFAGKPLVAHLHGFHWRGYEWNGSWAERVNANVMRLVKAADIVTAPSEWVAANARRHTSRDVRLIYHGVDQMAAREDSLDTLFVPVDQRPYALWNKTRVDAVCDPTAVRELALRLPQVAFHTTFWDAQPQSAGGHPQNVGGHPQNVQVLGKQPYERALEEVRNAAVYLATSRETFGIGTLEALAMGVPVVGFDFGGNSEIIDHLKDGYLARPGDWNDLARGVLWALKHRELISPWARGKAKIFGWERAVRGYAEVYKEAAEQQPVKVSIVVTAYNVARYLRETLQSVQMQSMPDWECIIVDDASPDASGQIADDFTLTDPRFRVIHAERNAGVAEARNMGIRQARGRYVLPLDGDDMLPAGAVQVLSEALDADRKLWVAYGNLTFLNDEDGATGRSGWPVPFDIGQFFTGPGQPLPYSSMFRWKAWQLTGGYRSRVRSSEDCDLWMRFASYGFDPKMVTTADTLIYRIRAGSRSQTEGHADVENKTWFPWRNDPSIAPAAAGTKDTLEVALLQPQISVVIPVGPDHAQLVKDAVDSVDAQTYRAWECIVVNDTGLDNDMLPELPSWVRILDRLADSRPGGVAMSRNRGAAVAKGRYLLFLDADDYLLPSALENLMEAQDIAIKAGREAIIYPDFWEDPDVEGEFRVFEFADFECDLVLQKALHAVTALYPRAAFEQVNGFSTGVPWEDWDLQLKLAEAGWCSRRLGRPVWVYRKHTGTRRVDRFQRKDDALASVRLRWGDYIEGRKTLAGCATCGGGRPTTVYPTPARGAEFNQKPANMGEAVLLEHTLATAGKQTLRGKATGALYNFQAGRPRWVAASDAPYFLSMNGIRQVRPDAPQEAPSTPPKMELVAHGPARVMAMASAPAPAAPAVAPEVAALPRDPFAADMPAQVAPPAAIDISDLAPPPATMPAEFQNGDEIAVTWQTDGGEVTRVPVDDSGNEIETPATRPPPAKQTRTPAAKTRGSGPRRGKR